MKKNIAILLAAFALISCSEEEHNLNLKGRVQGLKQGTLYLQKIEDSALVTVDSVVIDGEESFEFEASIEGPQAMYLYLNKLDNNAFDDRVLFFAEPGEMVLNTTLSNFETDVVVEGSENQQKLMEYKMMMQRFNDRNLELIQKNIKAQQEQNQAAIDSTALAYDNLLRRRYLFTVNFALNNKDYEVAPYLAVSEIYDANVKFLDTIYQSLSPKVKESLYGQSLKDFITERKAAENEVSLE